MAIVEMVNASAVAQALYVAARLGVADALAAGPMTAGEVAAATHADADAMHRLLRALAAIGVCAERDGGTFALTEVGNHLRTGVDDSVRSYVLHWAGSMWPVWPRLLHNVKTGRNPRDLVTTRSPFESLTRQPAAARIFNDAMTEMSALVAGSIVRNHDFSRTRRLVDVGGGHGQLLGAILTAVPALHGVLFDRPEMLEGAREHLRRAGVAERCEVATGSFFEGVPAGADAYILKSVLHDWNDEQARSILSAVRRAMSDDGTVLVVERVLPDRVTTSPRHRFAAASDLLMMVAASGRERTEGSYRALLESTGFVLTRIVETEAHYSLLEARRA
jgi:orsellinic acid C2-O-methyltransferase